MRASLRRYCAIALLGAAVACSGTTGGQLLSFPAAAAGPADAVAGQPLAFMSDMGWQVVLTRASLHVGAMYLNQSFPVSGAQSTECILPGTYVAQVTSGLEVDLLSPAPQPFPGRGAGTTVPPALAGQVWLTGGDVNTAGDPNPPTPVLTLAGSATKGATTIPFEGTITIADNRQSSGTVAGGDPICKERIVSPIPASIVVSATGGLLLRIDPRQLFLNVNFGLLPAPQGGGPYTFSDDPASSDYTQPSRNLYANLHSAGGLYTFLWDGALR
jgi:hypothetical protein